MSTSISETRPAVVAGAEAAGFEALPERPAASPSRTMLVPALRCDRCGDVFCGLALLHCERCLEEAEMARLPAARVRHYVRAAVQTERARARR